MTQKMTVAALFVALLSAASWITVPAAVPFTLQTFGVYLALLVLGGRWGTASVAVYLLLGFCGAPVFSGFRGGPGVLFGGSGGYLWGFLLMALLFWACEKVARKQKARVLVLVAGQGIAYFLGTAWFLWLYTQNTGTLGIFGAIATGVLPFLIPDGLKMALAFFLANRLKKAGTKF